MFTILFWFSLCQASKLCDFVTVQYQITGAVRVKHVTLINKSANMDDSFNLLKLLNGKDLSSYCLCGAGESKAVFEIIYSYTIYYSLLCDSV